MSSLVREKIIREKSRHVIRFAERCKSRLCRGALCRLLEPFNLKVIGHDPYLEPAVAGALGIELVDLPDVFSRAYVVSEHLPNIQSMRGLLNGSLFARMRSDATFINTGRGAQVIERDLIAVLADWPGLTALLDVTWPEPPEKESPLYALPNVWLSSYIAGSINDEVVRMADYVLEEYGCWERRENLIYAVSPGMPETMA